MVHSRQLRLLALEHDGDDKKEGILADFKDKELKEFMDRSEEQLSQRKAVALVYRLPNPNPIK